LAKIVLKKNRNVFLQGVLAWLGDAAISQASEIALR